MGEAVYVGENGADDFRSGGIGGWVVGWFDCWRLEIGD